MFLSGNKHPSLEEFAFQLTENQILSPCKPALPLPHSRRSLEYTLSRISIENELEDEVPHFLSSIPSSNIKDKECGYVTASTRHTLSSVKNTFQTLQSKNASYRQHSSLQKIRPTLTICPISFNDLVDSTRTKQRARTQEKFRLRKAVSVKERKLSQNMQSEGNKFFEERSYLEQSRLEVVSSAFKVKTISIEENQLRGKTYLKKLIQNRASILHISESYQPMQTKRSLFRM